MRAFLSVLFLLSANVLFSQTFRSRSFPEKKWAFFHPFAAAKVKKIYQQCKPMYEEVKRRYMLDQFENGGKIDALRHMFFMAAFSQKIKEKKVRKLGLAHEKGNYMHFKKGIKEEGEIPDSLSTVMDLHNNELGIKIGAANKKESLDYILLCCLIDIKAGKALYIKRNSKGAFLDCANEEVRVEEYSGKWFIPKCLLHTDQ